MDRHRAFKSYINLKTINQCSTHSDGIFNSRKHWNELSWLVLFRNCSILRGKLKQGKISSYPVLTQSYCTSLISKNVGKISNALSDNKSKKYGLCMI